MTVPCGESAWLRTLRSALSLPLLTEVVSIVREYISTPVQKVCDTMEYVDDQTGEVLLIAPHFGAWHTLWGVLLISTNKQIFTSDCKSNILRRLAGEERGYGDPPMVDGDALTLARFSEIKDIVADDGTGEIFILD